jgi:nitroreductase
MTTPTAPITVRDAIYARRSVRHYTGERLAEATVRELIAAAVRAPTAIHEEPWQFLVVQDESTLRRLSERAKVQFEADARRLHLDRGARGLDAFAQPDFNVFYDAGTLIVICGKPMGPFVVADCWLAAENLMLAAHALGLGSCVIGSAVAALNAPDVKKELGIPADSTAFAPLIVGTPQGDWPATARKPAQIIGWR